MGGAGVHIGSIKSGKQIGAFIFHEDGSFERADTGAVFPNVPANPEFVDGVASRDVILNQELGLWVRIFHPESPPPPERKLPIVIYFHGGGFVSLSPANAGFHGLCERLVRRLESIVVSVNYRLAPEHRLPAAYEDGYSVLEMIAKNVLNSGGGGGGDGDGDGDCELFASINAGVIDFSRIFIMGDSAGGNLASYAAVRAAKEGIKLAGQILLQPFFGGVARTDSELTLEPTPIIALSSTDFCWKVALPEGADRDHPYCNPAVELPKELAELGAGGVARALVVAGGKDLLRDRQVEFAKILESAGIVVKLVEYPNAVHGFYALDASSQDAVLVLDEIASFASTAKQ